MKKTKKVKFKIGIKPFKKVKDPVNKRKNQGCWGPAPDDFYNQC